ncbi:hypothetical protein ABZ897_53945 [Nonomuraea sp. NPDC046802]|uniref:hypothetical protein n=1 Tax=Nonomuraea sp. NPDC046802 TaxID=3154919 RepID=UPI0033DE5E32
MAATRLDHFRVFHDLEGFDAFTGGGKNALSLGTSNIDHVVLSSGTWLIVDAKGFGAGPLRLNPEGRRVLVKTNGTAVRQRWLDDGRAYSRAGINYRLTDATPGQTAWVVPDTTLLHPNAHAAGCLTKGGIVLPLQAVIDGYFNGRSPAACRRSGPCRPAGSVLERAQRTTPLNRPGAAPPQRLGTGHQHAGGHRRSPRGPWRPRPGINANASGRAAAGSSGGTVGRRAKMEPMTGGPHMSGGQQTRLGPAQQALERDLHTYAALLTPPGRRYGTLYALVLDLGSWHTPAPLPTELSRWKGPEGACYDNAAALADAVPGLRYVEGIANPGLTHPLPLDHAWCVDQHDVVHDPTWDVNDQSAYLGIPLTPAYRREALQRVRRFASVMVLDVYADPTLLSDGIPGHAIAPATPDT